MSQPFHWVKLSIKDLPDAFPSIAVKAGTDIDGSAIYVGRAQHANDVLPAKVIPSKSACYVAYGGEEIPKDEFEVMVPLSLSWRHTSGDDIPPGAVEAGVTVDGEQLYFGRVAHDGCVTPGKIHPSHGVCYYPFAGAEHSSQEYECLVLI